MTKLLPYNIKKTVLLNCIHKWTHLIGKDAQNKVKHNGERHSLAEVRNEY